MTGDSQELSPVRIAATVLATATLLALVVLALIAWRRPVMLGLTPNVDPVTIMGPNTEGSANSQTNQETPGSGVSVVAVADIACSPEQRADAERKGLLNNPSLIPSTRWQCGEREVAALIEDLDPTALLLPGDLQYQGGTKEEFAEVFHPLLGQWRSRTYPSIGNHEYKDDGNGYFDYFGSRAGTPDAPWYSATVGHWQVISLDSNCGRVDCSADGPQGRWLKQTLADSEAPCTVAMLHHPQFSSGPRGTNPEVTELMQLLHEGGTEIVLNGHEHLYERHALRDASGAPDNERGIQAFTVGTGGKSHYPLDPGPDAIAADNTTFGVLELTLLEDSYRWRFAPTTSDGFTDQGSRSCHA